MILMVCSSMFQLFTAIAIKEVFLKDKKVDLCLTDITPAFSGLCKNPILLNIFDEVIFSPITENISKLSRIEKSYYFNAIYDKAPKYYVKRIWGNDIEKKYDELYFSIYLKHNIMLAKCIKKAHKNARVHIFEDGISTYLIDDKTLANNDEKLDAQSYIDDIYMFEPKLMCLDTDKPLIKIPSLDKYPEIAKVLNEIFENADYEIKEKFVFFEESFNNDGYKTNDAELIETLNDIAKDEFILKHHPRNRVDRFKEKMNTIEVPMMWEQYFLKHSIDDKVLVTVSSNTAFVPKIINNSRPYVIFLYKLFTGTSPIFESGNFYKYTDKYLKLYKDYAEEKIFIPETYEEYKEIIKKLMNKEEEIK